MARFSKGQTPWNKGKYGYMGPNVTSFKKGQPSWNTRKNGSERLTRNGWQVKINGEFIYKHRYLWEQKNGPLEKDEVIIFLDGDKANCSLDNIDAINRSERMFLIKMGYLTADVELNKTLVAAARLKAKMKEKISNVNNRKN